MRVKSLRRMGSSKKNKSYKFGAICLFLQGAKLYSTMLFEWRVLCFSGWKLDYQALCSGFQNIQLFLGFHTAKIFDVDGNLQATAAGISSDLRIFSSCDWIYFFKYLDIFFPDATVFHKNVRVGVHFVSI